MIVRAVTVYRNGGTDVLKATDPGRPTARPGRVLVDVGVTGVNYMDVYQRTGAVPVPPRSSPVSRASASWLRSATA